MGGTLILNKNNIQTMIPENQNNITYHVGLADCVDTKHEELNSDIGRSL